MSYILDALRKADAERARGAVPDLHTQPVLRSSAGATPGTGARPWVWGVAAMAVTVACGLAWALLARDIIPRELAAAAPPAAAPPAAAVANATTTAPTPLPATSPIAPITTPLTAPTAPPTAVPTTAPTTSRAAAPRTAPMAALPAPAQVGVAPARPPGPAGTFARSAAEPVRPVARRPAADPAGLATALPEASAAVPTAATTAATTGAMSPTRAPAEPATRPAEPRLYTQAELPDEIRRALPALAIGGAMYSQNAASRMLIINGQVFHERDKLAPNLTLVQIRLKTAVLEYQGYRYSVSY